MFEILLGIAFIVFASKVGPAFARRISDQPSSPNLERRLSEIEESLEDTRERLAGLAGQSHERMVELEERVDFAERVLHQYREQTRLEPGEPGPDQYMH